LVLVDKRILAGGASMLVIGIILAVSISSTMPAGQSGMTEEEIIDLMTAQQEIEDYSTLSGILIGIGFLLVLISFGARRKKGSTKNVEKKVVE
jgi:ABC-type Fe3+ transport system permease subunit